MKNVVVSTLAFFLGVVLVINGLASTTQAIQRRIPTPSDEGRTGHWIQWGYIDGPHSLYTVKMTTDVKASRALREFQAHVDAGLPPPPRRNHYKPVGNGPFSEAQLRSNGLSEFLWNMSPEQGEVWLGMRNALSTFQNFEDHGYGPVPSHEYLRIWGMDSKEPQFYGGYEEAGIKSCRNILPVVWIWIWDVEKPLIQTPTITKCVVGPRLRTTKPEYKETIDGVEYTVLEFWDNCNFSYNYKSVVVECDPDSWYIIAEHGERSQGKLGKNFRVHEAVTSASKQKRGPMDLKKEVETDPQRIAMKQQLLWDILRQGAPGLKNDDKVKYLLVLVACSPDGSTARVKIVWFKDGWHWKEFFIGLALGIVIGYFIPKPCPADLVKGKFYSGTGNAPIPPPN